MIRSPTLARVDTVHDAAGPVNEDLVHAGDAIAWVLDGATGLGGSPLFGHEGSAAAHFVRLIDEELRRRADPPARLASLVESALSAVSARLSPSLEALPDRAQIPTAAIALAQLVDGRLDLFVLGDCRIVAWHPQGLLIDLLDWRHRALDEVVLGRMGEILATGAGFAESRAAVQDQLLTLRRSANRPGGYWILGDVPEAARQGISLTLENLPDDLRLLLMTDGFSALLDYDLLPSPRHLVEYVEENGLNRALALLRAEEDADPECRLHPRFKRRDDATAAFFRSHS
jgi:hypothetical protein